MVCIELSNRARALVIRAPFDKTTGLSGLLSGRLTDSAGDRVWSRSTALGAALRVVLPRVRAATLLEISIAFDGADGRYSGALSISSEEGTSLLDTVVEVTVRHGRADWSERISLSDPADRTRPRRHAAVSGKSSLG